MKSYYKQRMKDNEQAVAFRIKKENTDKVLGMCIYQNTIFDRIKEDDGIVYLDFENEDQLDKLIKSLEDMKSLAKEKPDENNPES